MVNAVPEICEFASTNLPHLLEELEATVCDGFALFDTISWISVVVRFAQHILLQHYTNHRLIMCL